MSSARKSRSASRHPEPTTTTTPQSYVTDLTGPVLTLEARSECIVSSTNHTTLAESYEKARLRPSCGRRAGHYAYLTMDQEHICVIGGRVLCEEEEKDGSTATAVMNNKSVAKDASSFTAVPEVPRDCQLRASEDAARLPPSLATSFPMLECYNVAEKVWYVPTRQPAASVALFTTPTPMEEGGDAVTLCNSHPGVDVLTCGQNEAGCGGVPRWPTQAAYAILPELIHTRTGLEEGNGNGHGDGGVDSSAVTESTVLPVGESNGGLNELPPPPHEEESKEVKKKKEAVVTVRTGGGTAAADGDDAADKKAKKKAAESNNNTTVAAMSKQKTRHAAAQGVAEAAKGNNTEHVRDTPTPTTTTTTTVVVDKHNAGPAEIFSIGGWNGYRRLNALLAYSMSGTHTTTQHGLHRECASPESGPFTTTTTTAATHEGHTNIYSAAYNNEVTQEEMEEYVREYNMLPAIHDLGEQLPALCHHSCTTIRDKVYLFGGDSLRGCVSGLYVLHHPALRAAYAEYALTDNAVAASARRSLFMATGNTTASATNSYHAMRYSHTFGSATAIFAGLTTTNNTTAAAAAAAMNEMAPELWSCSALPATTTSTTPQNGEVGTGPTTAPPCPRASHAACSLANRFLVIFGGRRLRLTEDAAGENATAGRVAGFAGAGKANNTNNSNNAAAGGNSARAAKKSPAAAAGNKGAAMRSGSAGRSGSRGRNVFLTHDEEDVALPPLQLFNDIAVFDTEQQSWVQVRIAGCAEVPAPRYGAALCALPLPTPGNANLNNTMTATAASMANAASAMMNTTTSTHPFFLNSTTRMASGYAAAAAGGNGMPFSAHRNTLITTGDRSAMNANTNIPNTNTSPGMNYSNPLGFFQGPAVVHPDSHPLLSALSGEQRELVLHGGMDEQGRLLNDAWLLHITSKSTANPNGPTSTGAATSNTFPSGHNNTNNNNNNNTNSGAGHVITSSLLETDAKTGAATLTARWIRLRGSTIQPGEEQTRGRPSEHHTASPSGNNNNKGNGGNNGSNNTSQPSTPAVGKESRGKSDTTPTKGAVVVVEDKATQDAWPARAHHVLVANTAREVYIVGGLTMSTAAQDGSAIDNGSVEAQNSKNGDAGELVVMHIPSLYQVVSEEQPALVTSKRGTSPASGKRNFTMSLHSSPNISVQLLPTPQAPPPGRFGASGAKVPQRRRESISRGYASNKDGSFLRAPSTPSGASRPGDTTHVGFSLNASLDPITTTNNTNITATTTAAGGGSAQKLKLSTLPPKSLASVAAAAAPVVDKEAVQWITDLYDNNNNTNDGDAKKVREAAAVTATAGGVPTPIHTSSAAQATMDAAERAAANMLHSESTSNDGDREGQPLPQGHSTGQIFASSTCTTDVPDGMAGAQHSFASTAEGRPASAALDDVQQPFVQVKSEDNESHAETAEANNDRVRHTPEEEDDNEEEDEDEAHVLNETQREGRSSGNGGVLAPKQQTPSPFATNNTNAAPPATSTTLHGMPRIAWKCGMCSYHMLAMDQSGNPLPFATSAFGNLLPLTCPRCQMTHTDWQPAVPFDEHGDHANIRSKLSNKYVELIKSAPSEVEEGQARKSNATTVGATRSTSNSRRVSQANPNSLIPTSNTSSTSKRQGATSNVMVGSLLQREFHKTVMPPLKPMSYYCSFCQRRLLRVDVNGELIAMDCDKNGEILPILCPGCNKVHNEWRIRPFQAHPPPTNTSTPPTLLPPLATTTTKAK